MRLSKKEIGIRGEKEALEFLLNKGYKLIQKNFRCPIGEIDLILLCEETELVFVEVRAKTDNAFCEPYETVTKKKQLKIYRLAEYYLAYKNRFNDFSCRFDVISIILTREGTLEKLEHLENAFGFDRL